MGYSHSPFYVSFHIVFFYQRYFYLEFYKSSFGAFQSLNTYNTHVFFSTGIYRATQKKRNQELLMFYHNLITIIIDKWLIFVKLRSSSFIWCNSYNTYFTHEWLKWVWREETKKSFGGRYLSFKEKITCLESWDDKRIYSISLTISRRRKTSCMNDWLRSGVKSFVNSAFWYGRQPVKTNSFDKIMVMQARL